MGFRFVAKIIAIEFKTLQFHYTPLFRNRNSNSMWCEPSVILGLLNASVIVWFFSVFENLTFFRQ